MKNIFSTSLFIFLFAFSLLSQTQIGLTINGEGNGDQFGRALSMPDE
jgi:hypothetical protein